MLKEDYRYLTYLDHRLTEQTLAEIVRLRHERENGFLWSARLATGLFGLSSCPAGNRGPKEFSEVILAAGDEGLQFLIETGFIPCPVCKPENVPGFWQSASTAIAETHPRIKPADFSNKKVLTFDARRLNWEGLLPVLQATPSRLYLAENIEPEDLIAFRQRFSDLGFVLPPVGYYDRNSPGHFFEYNF